MLADATSLEGPAAEDARFAFDRFQREPRSAPARYYPQCSPARPTSPLSFMSLGEIARGRDSWSERHGGRELADLRNAIAHGHYVSWASVQAYMKGQGAALGY